LCDFFHRNGVPCRKEQDGKGSVIRFDAPHNVPRINGLFEKWMRNRTGL
jgi:hypothetical protein